MIRVLWLAVALVAVSFLAAHAEASTYWRCACGYSTRDDGPMNNVDTFEALVDATRSASHAYDCEIAQAENLRRQLGEILVRSKSREVVRVAGLFDLFTRSRSRSSNCPGGRCNVPAAVKPQPLPSGAKASDAIEPTNEQKREAFYKAVREGRIEDAINSNDFVPGGKPFDGPIDYAIPPTPADDKPAPRASDHVRRKTVERVKIK